MQRTKTIIILLENEIHIILTDMVEPIFKMKKTYIKAFTDVIIPHTYEIVYKSYSSEVIINTIIK